MTDAVPSLAMRDGRRILLYGLVPTAVGSLLVAMYFSGAGWLQSLVSPAHQREYGLVENLQNLALIAIAVVCARAARDEPARRGRVAWRAVAAFALVVLLEELDWGAHYARSLTGRSAESGEKFNLHNRGDVTSWIKAAVDLTLLFAFVVLPWIARRLPQRVRPWIPSPHSVWTVVGAVAVSRTAHYLEDAGWPNNGSLRSNISEFRELFTYWLALLYLREVRDRRAAARGAEAATREARIAEAPG